MRSQKVELRKGTIEVTVSEMTVGELEDLFETNIENIDGLIGANSTGEAKNEIFEMIYTKIPEFIPTIKKEDIKGSYISELENLVEAFINVNFLGLKRIAAPLMKALAAGSPGK